MRLRYGLVFVVSLAMLMLFPSILYAQDMLAIEKIVQPVSVASGGTVKILLNITNPFGTEIVVKVRDSNSVGGSTVDTVCQMATLSSGSGIAEYMDIQAVMPGNYTLGTIEMKYADPVTGEDVVVKSTQDIVVEVTGGSGNVVSSSVQTIENCQFDDEESQEQEQCSQESQEEQEEQSLMDKLKEMMQEQQESREQQQEPSPQEQSQTEQKLSSARQNSAQDMNSVKQGLQEQAEAMQEQLEDELHSELSENKDFQEMQKDLEEKGYALDSKDVPPLKGNETNFTYDYKNDAGEKASISGNMKDGEVSDLKKMSSEDERQLGSDLENDEEFQNIKEQLESQGYEMDNTEFDGLDSDNKTDFRSSFSKPDGKTANVTGQIEDGDVSDIGHLSDDDILNIKDALEASDEYQDAVEEMESKNMSLPDSPTVNPIKNGKAEISQGNITATVSVDGNETKVLDVDIDDGRTLVDKLKIPFLILLLFGLVLSYYLYSKRKYIPSLDMGIVVPKRKKKINPGQSALLKLRRAEKLFEEGKMKEAYTAVSGAVRYYYKHTLNHSGEKELTSTEAIRLLKEGDSSDVSKAKECFSLCDLVKFAKYKPNKKDFGKILNLGRDIVG